MRGVSRRVKPNDSPEVTRPSPSPFRVVDIRPHLREREPTDVELILNCNSDLAPEQGFENLAPIPRAVAVRLLYLAAERGSRCELPWV